MKKKRANPSNTLRLRLFQEAGHHCAFCPEEEAGALEVHHIDGNRSNRDPLNLIMICATCHAKITAGVMSEADVRVRKRQLLEAAKRSGAFTSEDIKLMEGQFKHNPNDPIDYDSFNLETEDMG